MTDQPINRYPVFVLVTMLLCNLWADVRPGLADENRFVHPDQAVVYIDPNTKTEMKVLISQESTGTTEVTLAELLIPPGTDVPAHKHQSIEIFYILAGELEQTIEGKRQKLTAGMSCMVPANTNTLHKVTSEKPVRALVVWVPGEEEKRITEQWQVQPSR